MSLLQFIIICSSYCYATDIILTGPWYGPDGYWKSVIAHKASNQTKSFPMNKYKLSKLLYRLDNSANTIRNVEPRKNHNMLGSIDGWNYPSIHHVFQSCPNQ